MTLIKHEVHSVVRYFREPLTTIRRTYHCLMHYNDICITPKCFSLRFSSPLSSGIKHRPVAVSLLSDFGRASKSLAKDVAISKLFSSLNLNHLITSTLLSRTPQYQRIVRPGFEMSLYAKILFDLARKLKEQLCYRHSYQYIPISI